MEHSTQNTVYNVVAMREKKILKEDHKKTRTRMPFIVHCRWTAKNELTEEDEAVKRSKFMEIRCRTRPKMDSKAITVPLERGDRRKKSISNKHNFLTGKKTESCFNFSTLFLFTFMVLGGHCLFPAIHCLFL